MAMWRVLSMVICEVSSRGTFEGVVACLLLNSIALGKERIISKQRTLTNRAFCFSLEKGPLILQSGGCLPRPHVHTHIHTNTKTHAHMAATEAAGPCEVRTRLSLEPGGGGPSGRQVRHLPTPGRTRPALSFISTNGILRSMTHHKHQP